MVDLADARTHPWGDGLPWFVEPVDGALRSDAGAALRWFVSNRTVLDELTTDVGAVVLRGFAFHDTEEFAQLADCYAGVDFGYSAGATPRRAIAGRVFEATRAPAEHRLKLHQEMAYLPQFPKRLAFYCKTAPATGGETLVGDMRRFDAEVRRTLRDRVAARGIRYVRNFRSPEWSSGDPVIDAYHRPWTEAFTTGDPGEAESTAAAMGLGTEWVDGGLSVTYNAPGLVDHPDTGRRIWFNQIATQTLSVENVGEERRAAYDRLYASHPLPYDTSYGDGGPIDADDVSSLYPLLEDITRSFPWQHADVMLVDNFYTAHGRGSYTGHRDVQVALLT